MDETKEYVERTVGDAFIEWYNQITGFQFSFAERPKEAPDLKYSDNSNELLIEIGGAYPVKEEAAFWWQNLRKAPNAPQQVAGMDMDESLIADINQRIVEKCGNSYGTGCFLVLYVHPAMTTAEEVEERFAQITIPEINLFQAIFLTGHFPMSSNGSVGGYRCWRIFGQIPRMSKAKFITFEGVDGAGKSTHLAWFADTLRQRGLDVVVTREPGGTPLGEQLREILLNQPMSIGTEALLMFAARLEHIEQVIKPALHAGKWVISDRFSDASFAYQGGGRGMDWDKLSQLEQWVHHDLQPDLTLFFDVPVEIARQRLANNTSLDRFEQEQAGFFERVRAGYHKRVRQNPQRYRVIDAAQSMGIVKQKLEEIILSI